MKKYAFVLLVLCFGSFKSSAQETIIPDINYGLLEKYIAAAKDYYPRRQLFQAQEDMIKTGVTLAKISYLDIFNASYFYRPNNQPVLANPGNIDGIPNSAYNVNGVQLGVNINLGSFIQKPFLVKRAKAEHKVAQLQNLDYEITLISEVKRRYYTYIQMLGELKIKTQSMQDNGSVADNAKLRFERGEIPLDVYNASRILYADAMSSKIQVEVNYLTAKDALEEMLGKKLSEIK